MKDFNLSEKILKRYLKRKESITTALIVTFLITGGFTLINENVFARDLRSREKEANIIKPDKDGPSLNFSANETDVINILNPNTEGISHNKFTDLSIGTGNGVIFNNSTKHGVSQIGGYVTKNPNLTQNAKTILNEVTGNNVSNINGSVEIFGNRADFILANENGINLNGATFINANGVTLTTGNISKNNNNINFDVQKGEILLNGVGTSGGYFNVLAKNIQIYNEISPIKGESKPDITLISGKNRIEVENKNLKNPTIQSSANILENKYGIYANELGAMYGKNIKFISTGQGLGVKHEGAIFSEKDIIIDTAGNISVAAINSGKNINLKGNNFTTTSGTIKVNNIKQNNSITANNNIDINFNENAKLNSILQTTNGDITILAKNVDNNGIISTNNKVNITTENILNNEKASIKAEDLKFSSKSSFINKGEILATKNLNLVSTNNIKNTGKLGADSILLQAIKGNFLNAGHITAVKNLIINVKELTNAGSSEEIEQYLKALYKYSEIEMEKVKSSIIELKKKISTEKDANKLNELNFTLNKLKSIEEKFSQLKNILSQTGNLGVLSGENINLTTTSSFENKGMITTKKDLNLKANNLNNSGILQAEDNLLIQVIEKIINMQKMTANKNIEISANNFISSGNQESSKEYLNLLQKLNSKTLSKDELADIKAKIAVFKKLGVIEGNTLAITTKATLENNGIIISQDNTELKAEENINNYGTMSIGKKLEVTAQNFNSKNITVKDDFLATTKNSFNSQNLIVGKNIDIITSKIENSGELKSGNSLNIKGNFISKNNSSTSTKNSLTINGDVDNNGEIIGNGINIKNNRNFLNTGSIQSTENITLNNFGNSILNDGEIKAVGNISIKGENSDIKLNGNVLSKSKITVNSKTGNIEVGKIQALDAVSLSTEKDIINKGMVISNKDINLNADGILNKEGSTIWAGKNILINAIREIYNHLNANIVSQNNIQLNAQSITNDAGNISTSGNLDIKTDNLLNKSKVDIKYETEGTEISKYTVRWNDIFNYHLDTIEIKIPTITNKSVVTDKATMEAKENLNITGFSSEKSNINNYSGNIKTAKDLTIKGDIINEVAYQNLSAIDLLKLIQVKLSWETKLYVTNAHGNSNVTFEGSLYDALTKGYFGRGKEGYYKAMALSDNTLLNQALSSVIGSDWKAKTKPIPQSNWNVNNNFKYYAANGNAQIIAGSNFIHNNGSLTNNGGESGGNKNVNINPNLKVNITDINNTKEINEIKYPHNIELPTGSITLDGVTITAETGNLAGVIAVSGTINPITFINIPKNENGIFKPIIGTPKPGEPIFETNIEFINPNNFFGSDYFFKQLGYDKNKTSSVLGDAYYDYLLISKMIKEGLGYVKNITTEDIRILLENASKVNNELGLEVGKALTQEQINRLTHNIVWYVEVEVNDQKVLVPQLYLAKENRINLAKNQGYGGTSAIKVGGDFISDNTSFNNTNGNINANGNIIIKSSGAIINNSFGGMGGGISSNKNIAIDANEDVNMIGGNIKGDNVIVSGNNINLEASLGIAKNGDQFIADKAKIEGNNGIQIDTNNNLNIKGGALTTIGEEIAPKEKENSSEFKETISEEFKIKKDVNYYKKLFLKDSKDIITGDAGIININANGNVNIKDIHTISSEFNSEYDNNGFSQSSISSSISNGANIIGSNININGENINITGSDLSTNDTKENANKEALPGSININANKDINIENSVDSIHQLQYENSLNTIKGLLTQESLRKNLDTSLSQNSNIKTSGVLNITSGNNISLKGSDLIVDGNANITAKNNLNILDGRNEINESLNETRYQVLGGGKTDIKKSSSSSIESNILIGGELNASAENNIKIVNGNITSNGATNLTAGKDISIEAGKNEYHESKNEFNLGLYVEGSAGIGGVGVTGNASISDMSANGEISTQWDRKNIIEENLDGSNEKTPLTSGKPHMDKIVSGEFGVKLENKNTSITEKTWTEAQISSDNLNVISGNSIDIGGGDYTANKDIVISGNEINSTKYVDEKTEKSQGFSITVKNLSGVNSAVVDTINKGTQMGQAIKNGNASEGVLAAQGIGAVTNLVFNDAVGIYNKQSINLSIEDSKNTQTSENITSVDAGGNIDIKASKGNITLNGVDITAKKAITLNTKKDINIAAAKNTSNENGFRIDLEAQLEETAGVSALWGANADIGVGGSANLNITKKNSTDYKNSNINVMGNINITSGEDVNIDGGNVEAKEDVNLDIGKNLNIISKKSHYDNHEINANTGVNVSVGVASNTIGKGEVGASGGGGDIWSTGETVSQSTIKSGKNLNANIDGNLNIEGGGLGSKTGSGKIIVDGDIKIKDITTKEQAGGTHLTASGGFTGDFGVDGTIGDQIDKETINKGAIGVNDIIVNGKVNINGETTSAEDIYNDIDNSQTIVKNINKKGGDITFSGSTSNIKTLKNKLGNFSNNSHKTPDVANSTNTQNFTKKIDEYNISNDNIDKITKSLDINNNLKDVKIKLDKKNESREENKVIEIYGKNNSLNNTVVEKDINLDFTDKTIDTSISMVDKTLDDLLKEQQEIIGRYDVNKKGKYTLDQKIDTLKSKLKDYINTNKDKTLSSEQEKKIKETLDKIEAYDNNNSKYLAGKPQEYEKLDEKLSILTRSDKDIFQNLKSVAKESDKIPKEHLLNYLDKILKNTEQKEAVDYLKGENHEIILGVPKIEHNEESEANLNKIYQSIFERSDNSLREALNDEFKKMMQEDSDLQEMLIKKDMSPEKIEELAEKIQDLKGEAFENVLGVDYKRVDVKVLPSNDDLVGGNDGTTLRIYLGEKDSFEYILKTIVHELTHQDQNNLKNLKIEGFEDRNHLYKLNSMNGGYLTLNGNDYKTQPIEREAHDAENLVDDILKTQLIEKKVESLKNYSDSETDSDDEIDFASFVKSQFKNSDKYEVLNDKNAFDFPHRENNSSSNDMKLQDIANEKLITPEHYTPLGVEPPSKDKITSPNVTNNIIKDKNLSIENIISEINNDKFKKEYNKLDKLEQKLQVKREYIANLLDKQYKLTSKELKFKDKKELNKIEKELNKTLAQMTKLKTEQQNVLDKIDYIRRTNITEDDIVYQEIPGAIFKKDLPADTKSNLETNDKYSSKIDNNSEEGGKENTIYESIDRDKIDHIYEEIDDNSNRENIYEEIGNKSDKGTIYEEIDNNFYKAIDRKTTNLFSKYNKKLFNSPKQSTGYSKIENKYIRSDGEIKKQIDIVLNSNKNIPKEHLLSFITNLFTNKESKNLKNQDGIWIENEKISNNNQDDNNRLEKIYKLLGNDFEKVRVKTTDELVKDLSKNQNLNNLIFSDLNKEQLKVEYQNNPNQVRKIILENIDKKIKSNPNKIKEFVDIIQEVRKDIFKRYTDINYEKAAVKIETSPSTNNIATYSNGTIIIYPDKINSTSNLLDTIMHETTHLEQDLIRKSSNNNINQNIKDLYNINFTEGAYIQAGNNQHRGVQYKNQPIESEAFYSMRGDEVINKIISSEFNQLPKENIFNTKSDKKYLELTDEVIEKFFNKNGIIKNIGYKDEIFENVENIHTKNTLKSEERILAFEKELENLEIIKDVLTSKKNLTLEDKNDLNEIESEIEKITDKINTLIKENTMYVNFYKKEEKNKVVNVQDKDLNYYSKKIDDMLKEQEDIIFTTDIDKEKSELFKERYSKLRKEIETTMKNNKDALLTSKEKENLENLLEKIERIDERIIQSQSGPLEHKIDIGNGITVLTRSNKDILDNLKTVADNAENIPIEHLEIYLKDFYDRTEEMKLANKVKENSSNDRQIFVSRGEVEFDNTSLEALKKIEEPLKKKLKESNNSQVNIAIDKEVKTALSEYKNILEKMYPNRIEDIAAAFKKNDKDINKEIKNYLEENLKEKKKLPSKEELKELLDDFFITELEKWKLKEQEEEFVKYNNNDHTIFLRTPEGIKKQLEIVARDKNNIPPQHIQEFLANTFLDKGNKKSMLNENINSFLTNSSEMELDHKAKKNLSILYSKLDNSFGETRENMNKLLTNNLGKNKVLQNFILQNGKVDLDFLKLAYQRQPENVIKSIYNMDISQVPDEVIKDLFFVIQKNRKEIFENTLELEYKPSNIIFTTDTTPSREIASYNPQTENIEFYRNKAVSFGITLDYLLHESLHHEQKIIASAKNNSKISEEVREIYQINTKGYITPDNENNFFDWAMYKNQPTESEAFAAMNGKEIINSLVQNIIFNNIHNQELQKVKDNKIAKINNSESGMDRKFYGLAFGKQKNTEEDIPKSSTTNIETKLEKYNLGEIPLIFGKNNNTSKISAQGNSFGANKYANSYLAIFSGNTGTKALKEFAQKFIEGNLNEEDLENYSNFKYYGSSDDIFQAKDTDENRASSLSNREILDTLLGTQLGTQGLQKIYQGMKELEISPDNHLSKEKFDEGVREFFNSKEIIILSKTLEGGAQAYIDISELFNKNEDIHLENLTKIFDEDSNIFNSSTAHILRYILEKYPNNPNIKYMIDGQIIEIPKNLKTILTKK